MTGLDIYSIREDTLGYLLGIDPDRIVEVELVGRIKDETPNET